MILVTGSAGLLGANLMMTLWKMNRPVSGLYRGARFALPNLETVRIDLCDFEALVSVVVRLRPSWIVHCAAATNVDWCQNHPEETFRDNVAATKNVARAAGMCDARMVYISTDAVYGDGSGPHSETEPARPLNVYAQSKWEGEQAAQNEIGSALILRTTLYGWNAQNKTSLAEWVLSQLRGGKTVPGFVDVMFNPLLANDLAEVIVSLMDRECSGVYNVAGSESCSKFEFATGLAKIFGLDDRQVQRASIQDAHLAAARAQNSTLDTSKVRAATAGPMPDVTAGLLRFRMLENSGYATVLKSYVSEAA